jgi:hypothetical protein
MTAGRPCEYKDEYYQKAIDYLKDYPLYGDEFPMLCGLAEIIECDEDTLSNWGKSKCDKHETHEQFFGALKRLKNSQKRTVLNKTAQSKISTPLGIRVLAANHDMREKTDNVQEHKGKVEFSLTEALKAADGPE